MSGLSGYLKRMQDSVANRVEELEDIIWELALFLHKNPEIGGEERVSCQKIVEILSEHGFEVKTGVAGLGTAFVAKAVGRAERPCVAFLAEYDALPEIGHACGHNLIAAASVGAGLAVASVINELDGSVAVVGTPGEENIGGKAIMAEAGVFEQFDAALMFHPGDRNSLDQRLLALDPVKFTFIGKPAHASVAPHLGRDALDAIVLFINAVNALREHVPPDVRMHGIIVEAGVAPNIVPERAVAKFYVRALTRETLDEVTKRVVDCAKGAAIATGCQMEWEFYERKLDNMVVNDVLTELFKKNVEALGITKFETYETLGSSDVGNVSRIIPTIQPSLAIAPRGIEVHTREFAEAAASEQGKRATIIAAKALALTAVELLVNQELLERAKRELEEKVKAQAR